MMTDVWKQVRHRLEKTLNPGLFTVWIRPLTGEASGNKLVVSAPNEFVANWVGDRLKPVIEEAARDVMGVEPVVTIRVVDPAQAAPKPAPAKPKSAPRPAGLPLEQRADFDLPSWRFSFDDFVVGPSNELACAASRGLCQSSLNSDHLFLSSGPGLGKTHLLQSIGGELSRVSNRKRLRIACLSAEDFATRWVMALKSRQLDAFKAMFRQNLDVLLLEDIHFFQNKEKMQDELLGTLKALQERGCRVVLTSSFMPKELNGIDKSLVSRFCSGFMAHINHPDLDTRRRIVEHKASKLQVSVPVEVTNLLAESITLDIRQLESCLNNLVLKARLLNRAVTMDLAWEVLENYAVANTGPDYDHIIDFVCRCYDLNARDLRSKSRKQQIVLARNTAFYLARKHTELSLKDIGERLNRRHSTVLKGITKVEREISKQTPLGRQIANTVDRL